MILISPPLSLVTTVIAILYISLVHLLQRRRRLYIDEIAISALSKDLEPKRVKGSTWRVHNIVTSSDLRFESWLSMTTRGLLMTYTIPSISGVLVKTGGFSRDILRRYADMELLIREFSENAVDGTIEWNGNPERAKVAIQRVNAIHSLYGGMILHRDMLYVLSVFMCTPALWSRSPWSSRTLSEHEEKCFFQHWMNIGRMMNIDVDDKELRWGCLQDVIDFKQSYEDRYQKYSESNRTVVMSTIDYFIKTLPNGVACVARLLVLHTLASFMTARESAAMGLPSPPNLIVRLVLDLTLRAVALLQSVLLPPMPLSWMDRLTSVDPIGHSHSSSSSSFTASCPFKMYAPVRPLDFGNTTYTPKKGYIVEHMGPREVQRGLLVEKPIYRGS